MVDKLKYGMRSTLETDRNGYTGKADGRDIDTEMNTDGLSIKTQLVHR